MSHQHEFDNDGYGSCRECELPRANRVHLSATARPGPSTNTVRLATAPADTSLAAAQVALPRAGQTKDAILRALAEADPARGMTDDELAARLPHKGTNSLRPRRGDLVTEGRVVAVRDEHGRQVTRPTATGNPATAWTLAPAVRNLILVASR